MSRKNDNKKAGNNIQVITRSITKFYPLNKEAKSQNTNTIINKKDTFPIVFNKLFILLPFFTSFIINNK
jgi:hypothetical protein